MGYAHQWEQTARPTDEQWATIRVEVMSIIARSDVKVVGHDGTTDSLPGPAMGAIVFDGDAVQGYETFRVQQDGGDRGFCKTDRRAYDVVVAAVLCYLESTGFYEIQGYDPDDYAAGLALARSALPTHDIRMPATVED